MKKKITGRIRIIGIITIITTTYTTKITTHKYTYIYKTKINHIIITFNQKKNIIPIFKKKTMKTLKKKL